MKKILFLMALLIPFAGQATTTQHESRQSEMENQADKDLTMKVLKALREDSELAPFVREITISVEDGEVTIGGAVANDDISDKLEEKISSVPGVKDVENDLEVKD